MNQQVQDQRNQSSFNRKPPLRTNTSSSTTFSSISSMTSATSSVASPTAFSPSSNGEAFGPSPPSHCPRNSKENDRSSNPGLHYSPSNVAHYLQNQHQQPVVEPSVLQYRSGGRDEAAHELLNPGHFDTSATSNSSADTVSAGQHPSRTVSDAEGTIRDEEHTRIERSSSSSSSSSSLLSDSRDSKEPYETPHTAQLSQNEHQKRALDAAGYPFPAVSHQLRKNENQPAKEVHHDPWKHTDDLLAPSGRAAQQKPASQRPTSSSNTSTLSLSKPSPTESNKQHVSSTQTPTNTSADMDRRDSQSSSASSTSQSQAKAKAAVTARGGIALPSQSGSSSNLAKLSTSSSPAAGGGLASFSPLSALVEPFSPSTTAGALPSRSSLISQGAANATSTLTTRTGRTPVPAPLQQVSDSQAPYQDALHHRGTNRDERTLEGSTTSSSGDTGYFSNSAQPAGYGQNYQPGPPSAASSHSNFSADHHHRNFAQEGQDSRSARQRSWSENEALVNAPGLAYQGLGNTKVPTGSSAAGPAPWASPQQAIQEHIESTFAGTVPASAYGYVDPRYTRTAGPYGNPPLAGNEHYARGGLPGIPPNVRSMHVGQSVDSFDASRYGYGPGSVSDVSTAGAEEISTM